MELIYIVLFISLNCKNLICDKYKEENHKSHEPIKVSNMNKNIKENLYLLNEKILIIFKYYIIIKKRMKMKLINYPNFEYIIFFDIPLIYYDPYI